MKLIRIAIFDTDAKTEGEAKTIFVNSLMAILPDANKDRLTKVWDIYKSKNIIQVLLDLKTNNIVATMEVDGFKTSWQLNSEFMKNIPTIKECLENTDLLNKSDDYNYDELDNNHDFSNYYKHNKNSDKNVSKEDIEKKLNRILDEMCEIGGFENLSKDKQKFLEQYGNKNNK